MPDKLLTEIRAELISPSSWDYVGEVIVKLESGQATLSVEFSRELRMVSKMAIPSRLVLT